MDKVEIKNQRFSASEAKVVQSEIKKSPDITGYSLRELLSLKNVFKAYSSGNFAGACANFNFGHNWTELSAYVVLPKFRRQGIGRLLFRSALKDATSREKNIYIVSRNPAMKKIIAGNGIKIVESFWQLPTAVKINSLKFAISWYRAAEFLRKLPMKKSGKFIFGIKLAA